MYDDSPHTARLPLSADDVDVLLLTDGADLSGHPRRVRHLLTRVRATLSAHQTALAQLRRDVAAIAEDVRRTADPVQSAIDALGRCTAAQQRTVFDVIGQGLLDQVAAANAAASAAQVAAASETNRARLTLAQVAQIPDLSDEAREHLRRLIEQVPLMTHPGVAEPDARPQGGFTVAPQG